MIKSGQPALARELEQRLARFVSNQIGKPVYKTVKVGDYKYLFKYGDDEFFTPKALIVDFAKTFIDTVKLNISKGKGESTYSKSNGSDVGKVAVAYLAFDFPWSRTREEWEQVMLADPEAESKIAVAVERFNRSKGQFSRYDYSDAGYGKDYIFNTKVSDKVAMFIGFYRMVPVGANTFENAYIFANVPMCLQLETLMEAL